MGVYINPLCGLAAFRFACVGVTDPVLCTLGYRRETAAIAQTADQNAARIRLEFSGQSDRPVQAASLSNEWQFLGVTVTENRTQSEAIAAYEPVLGSAMGVIQGTAVSPSVPVNCALLLRKHTATGGRRGRGRMFLPVAWTSETTVTAAGTFNDTTAASLVGRWEAFRLALIAAGLTPVLLGGGDFQQPKPITSFSMSTTLATQRRRMR